MGGQRLGLRGNQRNYAGITNNPYLVLTITFDELLSLFIAYRIRQAIMKIDIKGSESFALDSGN